MFNTLKILLCTHIVWDKLTRFLLALVSFLLVQDNITNVSALGEEFWAQAVADILIYYYSKCALSF